MTVTVVLSSDGGKMSLFQDLKLKRRKVDSRCSSDGIDYIYYDYMIEFHLIKMKLKWRWEFSRDE